MLVRTASFNLPKQGHTQAENEDAVYPNKNGYLQGQIIRCAIADGASEGMLSGGWAKILVDSFAKSQIRDLYAGMSQDAIKQKWLTHRFEEVNRLLEVAYGKWDKWQKQYLLDREKRGKPIQWYEEPGLDSGAYSSLLMLELRPYPGTRNKGFWEAVAFGDSCMFQVRENKLLRSFPLAKPEEFNTRPMLLNSNRAPSDRIVENIKIIRGEWESKDSFFLATDALARWFLEEYLKGKRPWDTLSELVAKQLPAYRNWVKVLREDKQLKNDDVTLLKVDLAITAGDE